MSDLEDRWRHSGLARQLDLLCSERVAPLFQGHAYHERFARGAPERIKFYASLLARHAALGPGAHLVDLGAGLSSFGPLMHFLGLRVSLVDDFGGGGGVVGKDDGLTRAILERIRAVGIRVFEQDILATSLPFGDSSVDVITSFHSIEHWHHSPRRLFGEIRGVLRAGGLLVIGCPNAVNLRKRLWVLCGRTNLCALEEWYWEGDPEFRGHVREPTLSELCTLLHWNGFAVIEAVGRNFLATESMEIARLGILARRAYRRVLPLVDRILRFWPTLCSDLHVVGRKVA
jgi:SAM-dependent methyltransferase